MIKTHLRRLLPKSWQIPAKYWLNHFQGSLEPELMLLPELLSRGDYALDIGSNRGVYAYAMRRIGVEVDAFEPNPDCSQILISWSHKDRGLRVHTVALSDYSGQASLYIPIDSNGVEHDASASLQQINFSTSRQVSITLKTLDSYNLAGVSFVKIDVEGAEKAVLRGGLKTLNSCKPALLIEIEQRHNSEDIHGLFDWINDKGYRGFFFDGQRLRSIANFDVAHDQSTSNLSIAGQRYINNFLFLHQSLIDAGRYEQLFCRWSVH